MPRKRIKLKYKKNGKGLYQQLTNPLEEAHGRVEKLTVKMKNPPKDLREFWPPNLRK